MGIDYDVVIVGARCAGATTGLLLAQSGLSVLMLDSARFPSDTMSTLYVQPRGTAFLRRWGLLQGVLHTGCPLITRMHYTLDDLTVSGPVGDAGAFACAPRRMDLDPLLVDEAVRHGADFRDRARVMGVLTDGARVTGVRYRDRGPGAPTVAVTARLVIGADGMRSAIAKLVGAGFERYTGPRSCVYYAFHPAMTGDVHLYEREGLYVSHIPTTRGEAAIAAYFPQSRFAAVRRRAREHYTKAITAFTELRRHLRDTDLMTPRLVGTGDQQNFFRRSSGAGWVLVGDAAHHKDSITALGISDAFTQAELLSEAVEGSIHDSAVLDAAMRQYGAARVPLLEQGYQATLTTSRLTITPQRNRLVKDVVAAGAEPLFFKMLDGSAALEHLMMAVQPARADIVKRRA